MRRYVEKAKTGTEIEIMEQAPRLGRPTEIEIEPFQKQILEFLASRKYHVTVRSVEAWLKACRGSASKISALKLLNSVGCRRVRLQIKHKFLKKHIVRRFNYCWNRLDELRKFKLTGKSISDVDIFVDENWFNKTTIGSYLWLSKEVKMEEASEFWRDKSLISRIMYFSVIAEPSAKHKFDGRLLFKLLLRQYNAKRKSSLRPAGTPILETISMDRKKFNEVIIEVITSVVTKIPSFKPIRIIADGAGGHSVGKGTHDALNKSLTEQNAHLNYFGT